MCVHSGSEGRGEPKTTIASVVLFQYLFYGSVSPLTRVAPGDSSSSYESWMFWKIPEGFNS